MRSKIIVSDKLYIDVSDGADDIFYTLTKADIQNIINYQFNAGKSWSEENNPILKALREAPEETQAAVISLLGLDNYTEAPAS